MNVKISDLMSKRVIQVNPHHSVARVRRLMTKNRLHAVPVVDTDDHPVGIVSTIDLLSAKDETPVSKVMTEQVFTIPQYNDVYLAARLMRKHHIHHVVVTHEKAVVGILSTFDLLGLVEDHRFVMKPAPTPRRNRSRERPSED